MTRALVIGNPKAGRGRGFDDLETELRKSRLDFQVASTDRRGHAVEIAATASSDGYELVVAAGGDGTVHEVVNGLLSGEGEVPVLGVVPLGSGCDYVKTFGVPTDIAGAVSILVSEKAPISVDAGEITYWTKDGEQRRFFANIAEVGIGPEVVDRASRLPRFLGPAMYFVAFCLTLPRFKRRRATIGVDGRSHDVGLTNLVIAIGKAFGGGMLVAPKADPSDGLFDVQIQTGSKKDYVAGIPKVYKGTHIPHPRITEERAATVTVHCEPDATIEADGEVLGTTPATFTTLPGALRLKA